MGCQKSHGYVGTKEGFLPATWLYLINRPVNISVLVWVSPTVPLPWETIFPHRRFHLLFIILFPSLPFLFWVLWEPEYKCFFFFFFLFFSFFYRRQIKQSCWSTHMHVYGCKFVNGNRVSLTGN
jgi:hypothetical protein